MFAAAVGLMDVFLSLVTISMLLLRRTNFKGIVNARDGAFILRSFPLNLCVTRLCIELQGTDLACRSLFAELILLIFTIQRRHHLVTVPFFYLRGGILTGRDCRSSSFPRINLSSLSSGARTPYVPTSSRHETDEAQPRTSCEPGTSASPSPIPPRLTRTRSISPPLPALSTTPRCTPRIAPRSSLVILSKRRRRTSSNGRSIRNRRVAHCRLARGICGVKGRRGIRRT